MRDTAGAVLASGVVNFYQPGTLVAQAVYSDAACTTAITQPLTLNAGGQYRWCYTLEPVRMIAKDSTATVTHYDDIVNLVRHDYTYVTHASFNGGAETTLENLLTTLAGNIGANGAYLESGSATAMTYTAFLGELVVSVKNFGAVGDGTTDDTTAIQAAYDRVEARGGGWVYFPKGTYRVSSAITIDTAGVNTCGAGRGSAVIRNHSTTANVFTVNLGSSTDSKMVFKDIAITANSTSSGAGISFTNGNSPVLERVAVTLHRTGIATASVTDATLRDIVITSTDDNASGVGVSLGTRARISDSRIECGTDNGTGVVASGDDTRVVDVYLSNWATAITLSGVASLAKACFIAGSTTGITASGNDAMVRDTDIFTVTTGITLSGTRSSARGCLVTTCTTAYSLTGAGAKANGCTGGAATTGFSVGAVANVQITGCTGASNTTDLTVNASATTLIEHSNHFATVTDSSTNVHLSMRDRPKVLKVTKVADATTTPSFTPTPATCDVYVCDSTSTGAVSSFTVNATSTTGLVDGQLFTVVVQRAAGGSGTPALTINSQYAGFTGAGMSANQVVPYMFIWRASSAKWQFLGSVVGSTQGTGANW